MDLVAAQKRRQQLEVYEARFKLLHDQGQLYITAAGLAGAHICSEHGL